MREGYIAVIDSGIGGLNVLKKLAKTFPNERYLYFGDNGNAPYGNKSIDELLALTIYNLEYLKHFGLKAIVLGCNTLSTCIKAELSKREKLPIFGVFPPIEQLEHASKKTLLLATVRTAEKYTRSKNVDVIGMSELANDIEKNIHDLSSVSILNHLLKYCIGKYQQKQGYYDTIILGCTHYSFVKNQIFDHFRPRNMFSSEDFFDKQLFDFLSCSKSLVKHCGLSILFVGDFAEYNQKIYFLSG